MAYIELRTLTIHMIYVLFNACNSENFQVKSAFIKFRAVMYPNSDYNKKLERKLKGYETNKNL